MKTVYFDADFIDDYIDQKVVTDVDRIKLFDNVNKLSFITSFDDNKQDTYFYFNKKDGEFYLSKQEPLRDLFKVVDTIIITSRAKVLVDELASKSDTKIIEIKGTDLEPRINVFSMLEHVPNKNKLVNSNDEQIEMGME